MSRIEPVKPIGLKAKVFTVVSVLALVVLLIVLRGVA